MIWGLWGLVKYSVMLGRSKTSSLLQTVKKAEDVMLLLWAAQPEAPCEWQLEPVFQQPGGGGGTSVQAFPQAACVNL